MDIYTFAAPQLQVWLSDEPHAQARAHLDQGAIEVTQGLLDAWLSDDELYAALAHEGAHLALHAAQCPATDRERHAQELEADRQAAELLRKAGRDPEALARALRKLEDEPTLGATPTHPAMATRLEALRE